MSQWNLERCLIKNHIDTERLIRNNQPLAGRDDPSQGHHHRSCRDSLWESCWRVIFTKMREQHRVTGAGCFSLHLKSLKASMAHLSLYDQGRKVAFVSVPHQLYPDSQVTLPHRGLHLALTMCSSVTSLEFHFLFLKQFNLCCLGNYLSLKSF